MGLAVWALGGAWAGGGEPPLPVWDEEERKALEESGWVPGAMLLSDDPLPDEVAEPEKALDVEPPTAEELAEDDEPTSEIPEEYVGAYFAQRPERFLVDPQNLLGERNFQDRLSFLSYHSGDSTIDLYIYVFGGNQEIPGEVREEEVIERFFSEGRPAAVVYYHLGAPQRSSLYLSPSLTDVVSAAEQRRAVQSSVMSALEHAEAGDQFEAFSVQMSIRIYWMERMMGGGQEPGEAGPLPERLVAMDERRAADGDEAGDDLLGVVRAKTERWWLPLGVGVGALVAGWVLGVVMRRRARFRFPEFEIERRMGGDHAAGIGAVISFASASLPPSSQRDQVPDYLRRA